MSEDNTMSMRKKTKTFTGCATCRSRKIKCDLQKPSCQRCAKSGLVCAGYQIVLCWSRPLAFDKYGGQIRSSIFPDDDSVKGFQRRSIDFVKYEREYEMYDEMDKDLAVLHSPDSGKIENNQTFLQGPFGVFEGNTSISAAARRKRRRTNKGRPVTAQSVRSVAQSNASTPNANSTPEPLQSLPLPSLPPSAVPTQQVLRPGTNNEWLSNELRFDALLSATAATSTDQTNNFFFDFLYPYNNNQTPTQLTGLPIDQTFPVDQQVFNALRLQEHQELFDQIQQTNTATVTNPIGQTPQNHQGVDGVSSSGSDAWYNLIETNDSHFSENIIQVIDTKIFPELSPSLNMPTKGLKISSLTRYLLDYYYETVADRMSVVPFDSNPWKSIYFPRAVQALGDLSALGRSPNSKIAILHALLAVSCFCLQSKCVRDSTEMKFFLNLGIEFRSQASLFLRRVFKASKDIDHLFDSKVEKYKDVLIAILSMNTIDVVWGTMADCQYYLSLCEKIISKRMKERPQLSNKAKILHRVFSFLKLLQDSTNLKNLSSIDEDAKSKFINRLIEAQNNGDTTEFYENVDQDGIIEIGFINKAMINGEYKPEFIDEKNWKTKTNKLVLTDALYGLPNSLILLFSEVVKIIKIKIYLDKNPNESDQLKLTQISKNLEKKILNWKTEWKLRKDNSEEFLTTLHKGIYHHSTGFYDALVIYYYTMVQNVDHSMLQKYSVECINHLEILRKLFDDGEIEMYPLIWQGFISGCSAIDKKLQDRYREWTSQLATSGVGSYWGARQIMFEVWRRRENHELNDNWLSVHRDWDMNIMVS